MSLNPYGLFKLTHEKYKKQRKIENKIQARVVFVDLPTLRTSAAHTTADTTIPRSLLIPVSDHPLMITNMRKEWAVAKVELVDGLYSPACVTVKVVLDHFAIGVIGSFAAVGLMHAVYWRGFISREYRLSKRR